MAFLTAQRKDTESRPMHNKRPRAVSFIGWLVAILGAWNLLNGFSRVILHVLSPITPTQFVPADMMDRFPLYAFMAENDLHVAFLQGGFAAIALIAGGQFLKLKLWAKYCIEVICWISVVCILVFGLQYCFGPFDGFAVIGVVSSLIMIWLLGFVIILLRSSSINATFKSIATADSIKHN
jgi:hypothetical protein